ncbi:adenosine deaminase-like [Ruditapes philippinarum]|uniref:adenosine deaminase-like n=1 Tax=Ruditapes philippinarum TaxID=129788 RepID=UPI00295ACA6B|nr:adenosine deaminase-like [Ruditapes philippinarum]
MDEKRQRVNPTKDNFPYKVELHVHLDGAFRLSSVYDIARRRKIDLKVTSIEDFRKNVCVYHAHSLYKVLSSFVIFMPIIAGDREAISRLVYEFCEDSARNNIKYVEARYSPHLLANSEPKPEYALQHGDLTPHEVVQLVNVATKKGMEDFKIRVKTILCCIRHRPDWSEEVVDLAEEFKQDGVVAIDIAGGSNDESVCVEFVHEGHKKAFNRAKQLGIHITVHAGEAGTAASVKEALDDLHAERIGHGYRVLEDEKIYKEVREKHVHLETCPISSICTGAVPEDIHKHPVVRFAEDKANYSLNSDDPFVFDSCLLDDYNAAVDMGLTDKHIVTSIFNAAKSCFASDDEKKEILKELVEIYGDIDTDT